MNKRSGFPKKLRSANPRLALEQRIVFDAAVGATVADTNDHSADQKQDYTPPAVMSERTPAERTAAMTGTAVQRPADGQDGGRVFENAEREVAERSSQATEIIFIESSVQDIQSYLHGKNAEVVILDASRDGMTQIAETLAGRSNISAIHIVSHGDVGEMYLGTGTLDLDSLHSGQYAEQLAVIRNAMTADGDILLYGCEAGKGVVGQAFVTALADATDADVAASSDGTGATDLGGNWTLETSTGRIETLSISAADWHGLLDAVANNNDGALLAASGNSIYSIDITTGKATLLTTVPTNLLINQGTAQNPTYSINSLAVDQANGLIYYADGAADNANRALYAFDYRTAGLTNVQRHIAIDTNLTDNGAGASVTVGARGVGSGSATFANGTLYLGVELNAGNNSTNSTVYRISFTGNGRTVSTVQALLTATTDWGDLGYDSANNALVSITTTNVTRYNALTGAQIGAVVGLNNANSQAGESASGRTYRLGTQIQEYNPATGALVGNALAITTNGTTALGAITDAAGWTPPTGVIGDQVFYDNNNNGTFDAGVDVGIGNVTVELIDDINNNGTVDAGERTLATDTTSAAAATLGQYRFTGVLPGNYIVRITDANGVLVAPTYTTTGGALNATPDIAAIGGSVLTIDFGVLNTPPVNTVPAAQTTNEDTARVITGVSVADSDNNLATTQISVTNGVLAVSLAGGATISAGANNSSTLTLSGTQAQINAALANITFTPALDYNGAAVLTVLSTDRIGLTDSDTVNITVTPVNDNPVLTTPATLAYLENQVATAIDPNITVSDVDNTTLASATVSIGTGFAVGQDVLAFTNQNGIVGNYNAATGVLTLSGTATVAQYQAALRSVTYFNSSDNPATAARSVSYQVNDGQAANNLSNAVVSTVNVTAVNDNPVLTGSNTLAYTENQAAAAIDPNLVITDPDNTTMTGVTVAIGAGFVSAEDVLGFANQNGIVGNYNAATGVLTLTGTATTTQYQTALRSVTYANTSENPSGANRTVNYTVDDGTGNSNALASTVTVTPVNDAPVISGTATLAYTENQVATAIDGNIALSDVDNTTFASATVSIGAGFTAGQDVLVFTDQNGIAGSYNAATGILTLSGTASVANYQAALRSVRYFNSSDNPTTAVRTVNYQVNDGQGANNLSNTQTATVNVTAVNDTPVLTGTNTLAYTENQAAAAIDPNLVITDPDSANLTGATVSIGAGFVAAEDVLAFTNQNGITGSYNAATGVLTLTGTTTVANYQAALRSVTYANTSENPSAANRTVAYVVNDGSAANNLSTALNSSVTVAPVNDNPVVSGTATLAYTENQVATAIDGNIALSDVDNANLTGATVNIGTGFASAEDVLGFTTQNGITGNYNAATGVLTLTGTATVAQYQAALRSVTYANTSENPSTAARTISYQVNDGQAANNLSNVQTATVNVTAVNDNPVLTTPATLAYTENQVATVIDANLVVSDVDNANLTGATVSIGTGFNAAQDVLGFTAQNGIAGTYNATTGVLTLTGTATVAQYQAALRSVTYFNNSDNPATTARTVNYQVNDGQGANNLSNVVASTVNVTAVNDSPVLTGTNTLAYTENQVAAAIDPNLAITDADSANLTGATVSIGAGFAAGEDVLGFTNQNGITGTYNAATGVLTLAGTATVANYQAALRSVTYVNTSENPSAAVRTVAYVVNDGSAANNLSAPLNSTVNVTPVNDNPVIAGAATLAYTENQAATAIDGNIALSDVDNTSLTGATVSIGAGFNTAQDVLGFTAQNGITGTYNATTGVLTLTGTATVAQYQAALRSVTYFNNSDDPTTAARTVNYQVNDGQAANNLSNVQTTTVNVTAVNDVPVLAGANTLAYTENQAAAAIDPNLVITDPDNTTMTGATVAIGAGFVSAEDALGFTAQNGITGTYNTATGVLTLTGTATTAQYQAALRSVTYVNTSENPSGAPRTVSYTVNDGTANSNTLASTVNVTPVNDNPVVAGTATLAYTENQVATAIDGNIALSDVDNTTLSGATVSIGTGFASAEDVLGFTAQNGITGSYNAATGVLTLTGTATVAQYQAALRSVTYANTSENPSTTARTVNYQVNDGQAANNLSNVQAATVNITAVNDVPVLTGTNTLAYTENQVAAAIDPNLVITDPDSANLTGATVSIGAGFAAGQDVLAFINQNGIAGNYDATTGVLTLTGTATTAQYQDALRSVTYANTSENPSGASRTVNYTVNDGTGNSNTLASTITVTPVNDAPVLSVGNTLAYTENQAAAAIDPNLVVSDVDSANLTGATVSIGAGFNAVQDVLGFTDQNGIVGSYNAATGVLTLTGTATVVQYQAALRSVTYANTSDTPSTAARTVNFQVNDGQAANNLSNVVPSTINVTAVNDVPVANSDVASTTINTPVANINVLGNDTDADGDPLSITTIAVVGNAATGTVTVNADGTVNFTPATNFSGPATINYTISDGKGGTASSTLTVNVGANTPPDSANATVTTNEDTAVTLTTGSFAFTDADAGQTLAAVRIDTLPTAGTLTLNGTAVTAGQTVSVADINAGLLVYTPALNGNGTGYATFTFSVQDSGSAYDTTPNTVTVNVTAVNDAPVANPDTNAVAEDATLTVTAANGVIQGAGADTDVDNTTASLVVSGAVAGTGAVTQGAGVNTSLAGTYGHLTLQADGSYIYVADTANALAAGQTATETFTYTVRDPGGLVSNTTTLTITVTGTNDNPVANPDTNAIAEDATLNVTAANGVIRGAGTDTDVDSTTASLVVSGAVAGAGAVTQGAGVNTSLAGTYGHLTVQADGSYVYVADTANALAAGQTATDTFTYTVRDPSNGVSNTTTLTITVTGTNDAPVAVNDTASTAINTPLNNINVLANDSDVDAGDTLTVTSAAVVNPALGTVVNNGDGTLSFTPATNVTGPVAITYSISDGKGGTATATLTVNVGANTPPDSANATVTTNEDTAVTLTTGSFAFTDADAGQTLAAVRIDTLPTAGTLTLNGTAVTAGQTVSVADINAGLLVYTPALNGNGTGYATFTFSVQDSGSAYDTAPNTVTVNVTAVNDAPVNTLPATFTTAEDTAVKLAGLSIVDVDANGGVETITLSVASGTLTAANGTGVTVTGSGTGSIVLTGTVADLNAYLAATASQPTFTPATDASGLVTLTMVTNDGGNTGTGGSLSDTDTSTITVTAVNDAPVNTLPATFTTNEDTPVKLAGLSIVDVDANGGVETITLSVASGTLTAANGTGVTVTGSGTGSIVLTGTVADLNAYLAATALQPTYTPAADANGPVTLTMVTNDGGNTGTGGSLSDTDISTINVTPVNDAPVLSVGNTLPYTENQAATAVDPNLVVSDVDSANLTGATVSIGAGFTAGQDVLAFTDQNGIVGSYNAATGVLTLTGTATVAQYQAALRSVTYANTSDNPSTAVRTVNYQVNDGQAANNLSNQQPSTINITAVNDVPVAVNDSATTAEDTPLTLSTATLVANDTDADGDTLTITSVQGALGGTVALSGTDVVFTPTPNYNGAASFTYTVSDGKGGTATATVNITVTAVNDAPVANPDSTSTAINVPRNNINVLGNDTDVDNDPLTVTGAIVGGGAATGTVTVNNDGTLNFTPAANFSGPATISYTISDGKGGTATGTLTVNVGANTPPDSIDRTVTTPEDTSVTLGSGTFAFVDADTGQTLQAVRIDSLPTLGTLTLNGVAVTAGQVITAADIAGGKLVYAPALNGNGGNYAGFNFSVQDSAGAFDTTPNTVTFNVTPVNDAPVAVNDTVVATEDTPLTIPAATLTGNDTDVDGDTLVISAVTSGAGGTVALDGNGNVVFTPAPNFNGPATFTYTVSDGKGGTSTATVTVNVAPVNDAPVANGDAASTPVNVAINNIDALGNDTDVDGDPLTVTGATVPPAQGTVTVNNADGTLNFTPATNFSGPATITYTISDGKGGTATGTLTVNVGANTPPDSADTSVTTAEDTSVTLTTSSFPFTDADAGQTLAGVRIETPPANGTLTLNGTAVTAGQVVSVADINAGRLVYAPALNGNGTGYATFTFSVQDSAGAFDASPNTVTVNVTPVNDAPVAVNDTATTAEDTPLVVSAATLLANDSDVDTGDVLTITTVQGALGGTVSFDGTNVTFTPTANYNGPASFTYTVSDGKGGTATATVNITVTAVNDAPVANPDAASTPVNTPIANINVLGNDSDVDGDPLTVTGATVPAGQGTVTVNPDGTINFTPATNFSGPATVSYTVSDGKGGAATGTLTVNVGANTPPDSSNTSVTTNEDTAVTLTTASFPFTDADAGQTLAAVRIDTLPAAGTLTLNGVAVTAGQVVTVADINAGRLVFTPVANANGTAYAAFNFSVQDSAGAFDSAPNTLTVDVTPVNDAPVAVGDAATTAEDTPITLSTATLTANDSDVDNDTLTIVSVQNPVNGTVALNGTDVVFTPTPNYNGAASFTYTVSDGKGGTSTATVNITVTSVNDAPVAVNDIVAATEDTPLTIAPATLLGNDTDVDNDPLTISSVQGAVGGTVALDGGGNVVFTPAPNFNGAASFTYTVADGKGGTSTATVTVNVAPVNDAPVANADSASTPVNVAIANINVLGNDSDVDGDPLTVTSASVAPVQGTVTVNNDGTINFTPATNFSGPATISYDISDGKGGTATGTLTVNVGANTPPDSANTSVTTNEDTSVTLTSAAFPFTDADAGQTLTAVRIDALPAAGTLTLNGVAVTAGQVVSIADINAGNLRFAPASNGNGNGYATFNFSVQDSAGAFDTTPNTVTFNVTPVNDAPVAVNDSATTAEDTPLTLSTATLTANDTDVDTGDTLTITSVQGAVGGTVALNGTDVVFTPNANFNGPASFTYTVSDGKGGSSTATVNITVTAVNDAPVANNDLASTPVNSPVNNINVLGNDTDVDGDPLTVTGATVPAAQGTVTVNPDGTLNFTPATNFSGPATVTYTIGDGKGGTATGTLTVSVGANTPPDSAAQTITTQEDTSVTLGTGDFAFNDPDAGQTLAAVRIDSVPTRGTLLFNGTAVTAGQVISAADIAAGRLTFVPAANGNGGNYASFNFSVQDSAGAFDVSPNTVTFNVTPVNDAPVANPDTVTTAEDTALTIAPNTLLGNDTDVDLDTLTITAVGGATNGTVAVVGGSIVFTPNANYNGPATFTYTVSDGNGGTATGTVTVNVTPVNDAPVATSDAATTAEDTPLTLSTATLTANDTDVDGDTLTITSVQNAVGGTVALNGTDVVFTPNANFNGPASFTYTVSDGNGGTSTATVNITVTAVNDNPVANPDATSTPLNVPRNNINVLGNDTDVDGNPLTVTGATVLPAQGTVTVNNDGTLNFTPATNFSGNATISYTISDGDGGTATGTLTVSVGANTPPDSIDRTVTTPEDTAVVLGNGTFAFVDADAGQSLSAVRIDTLPTLGTLTLNGVAVTAGQVITAADISAGKLVYAPALNGNGGNYAGFNFSVQDSGGAYDVVPNTVTFNVTPVNDAPVAVNDTVAATEDTPLTIPAGTLTGNDTDVDGDTLVISTVTSGTGGTVALDGNGNVVFTPTPNFNGPASFTYTVSDGKGGTSTATVTVNVAPVNDAPVANGDTASTAVNAPLANINVLGNDTDVDGDPLTVTGATVPAGQGTVTVNNDGTLNFTPATNFSGPATVTYAISDGKGGTATGTLTVNVGANTPPDSADTSVTTTEDTPVTLTTANFPFTDADAGQTFSGVRIATLPAAGTLTLNGVAVTAGQVVSAADIAAGRLVFAPAANGNGTAYATFTFSVQDSAGAFDATPNTVTVNVTPVNDVPVAANDTATTAEDTPLTLSTATLTANDTDADGDALTITSVQGAVGGTVALNGTDVVFTPTPNFNGPASFTYTVSDGKGGTSTATVNIIVTAVNDAPVANPDAASTPVNAPLANINVLGNDTDVDGDPLTVTSATVPAGQGTVTVNNDGTINFTPATNFSGTATVSYVVSDGKGGTATGTLTVNVGANTPPDSANATVTTAEDTPLTLTTASFAFADADAGQTLAAVRIDTLPATGTLTLNGVAVTTGQVVSVADINAGRLVFSPAANGNGTAYAAFNFSVQDSAGAFDTAPNTVTVNVTPVNDAPVATNDAVTTAEDTPLTLTAATLLANDSDVDGDTLSITSVQGAVNGTVSLNGTNVVFTPNANYNGPASFTYTVSDGKGGTSTATVSITVTSVNDNPVANADTVAGTEDTPLTLTPGTLLGNDTDVDGDTLTISSVQGAVGGSVSLDAGGNVVFTPAPNFNGPASFTYTVSDGKGGTSTATVTVNVAAVNDVPVTNPDTASTPVNTPATNINVLGNDSDVDGDPLTVTGVTVPAGQGTVTVNPDGTLNFTPATNFSGPATVTYVIDDGKGGTATGTLTVNVGANTPPDSANTVVTTPEDTAVTLTGANFPYTDADAGQSQAAVRIDTLPAVGTLTLNGVAVTAGQVVSVADIAAGRLVFTPALNGNGNAYAAFNFSVQDSVGAFDTTPNTVTVNVTPVNDAPVAANDTATVAEDTPLTLTTASLTANDSDVDGDTLTITSVQGAVGGTVTLNGGNIVFTPNANYNGPASFTYTVSDGNGGTATATVNVNVTAVNDAPVANNDLASTPVNGTLNNINVLGNDTDVDGDPLTVTGATMPAGQGTVTVNPDGTLNFTPAANFSGPATVTYAISDGKGGTATGTLTVNVGANTPPDSAAQTITTPEDTSVVLNTGDFAFNDPDAGQTLNAVRIDAVPARGTLLFNGTAVVAGQVISATDIAAGKLVFVPAANENGGNYASFNFSVQDSAGAFDVAPNTVTFNVTTVNDAPVANPDTVNTPEDTPLVLTPATLLGNDADVDGDTLTITAVGGATNGTVALVGGNIVFTPNANYNGPASFTYTVSDGSGATSTATVIVNVASVNDLPVANPDAPGSTREDTPVSGNVLTNDTDADGDVLTVGGFTVAGVPGTFAPGTTATIPGVGTLVINSNGSYTFTPAPDFNGAVPVVTYTAIDGKGGSGSGTLSLGPVTPVNDAPVVRPDAPGPTPEDTPVRGNLLANDTDVDGDVLTVSGFTVAGIPGTFTPGTTASIPGVGTLLVNTDGSYVFTPAPDYNGNVPLVTYTAIDGQGGSGTGTLSLGPITPVNDAPVVRDDAGFIPPGVTARNIDVLGNDTDADGDPLTVIGATVPPGQGAVTVNPDGTLNFTPAPGVTGVVRITYTVSDGHGGTGSAVLSVTVGPLDDPLQPAGAPIDYQSPPNPGFGNVASPSLHVAFSINEARSDSELRSGLGIFSADSVTTAELQEGLGADLSFAEGIEYGSRGLGGTGGEKFVREDNALFVQHAVRHQALGTEIGLFVQDSVRSSQLEALARNARINAYNSATPGVSTLFDPFALGAPAIEVAPAPPDATAADKPADNRTAPQPRAQLERDRLAREQLARDNERPAAEAGKPAPVRKAAAGFAAQLRSNAADFRPRMARTDNASVPTRKPV